MRLGHVYWEDSNWALAIRRAFNPHLAQECLTQDHSSSQDICCGGKKSFPLEKLEIRIFSQSILNINKFCVSYCVKTFRFVRFFCGCRGIFEVKPGIDVAASEKMTECLNIGVSRPWPIAQWSIRACAERLIDTAILPAPIAFPGNLWVMKVVV